MPTTVLESSGVPLGLRAAPDDEVGGMPMGKAIGRDLDFTVQHQKHTQWCWAAVASSVARYYGPTNWTQCRVVNSEFQKSGCCAFEASGECNKPWYLDRALTRVGNLAGVVRTPLTLPELRVEIDAARPVGVRVAWAGGGGHFVTIRGYSRNIVEVSDPWYGDSPVDYRTFRNRYQGIGRWTHSYRTMR